MRTRRIDTGTGQYRNKEYEKIARRLIKEKDDLQYLKTSPVAFVILSSEKEKKKDGKIILGECQKVDIKYRWYVPFDFQIVIYDLNCAELNDEQLAIVLWHELRHIGIDETGNEPRYYVVPHDVEDFDEIIKQYGLHWEARE